MYAVSDMPTKLKRLSVTFEVELFQALEAMADRNKRSMSNQINIILEQALLASGDLKTPIAKTETRGGKRANAGRKPRSTEAEE
jgi:hypothetical protein